MGYVKRYITMHIAETQRKFEAEKKKVTLQEELIGVLIFVYLYLILLDV